METLRDKIDRLQAKLGRILTYKEEKAIDEYVMQLTLIQNLSYDCPSWAYQRQMLYCQECANLHLQLWKFDPEWKEANGDSSDNE